MQCPTYQPDALKELRETLAIPELGTEDWDLVCAASSRVGEFCDAYERAQWSAEAKVALMQLIVASYNDYLNEQGSDVELQQRLINLLTWDFDLHGDTIRYWSRLESHEPNHLFAVSPLMRDILQQLNSDT